MNKQIQKQMQEHFSNYRLYKQKVAEVERLKEEVRTEMGSSAMNWQSVGKMEAGNYSDIVARKVERIERLQERADEAAYWIHIIEITLDTLTDKQAEIMREALKGKTNGAIAAELFIGESTVVRAKRRMWEVMAELSGENIEEVQQSCC
jgi:DNA-binding NarL/FixJ family response regulator